MNWNRAEEWRNEQDEDLCSTIRAWVSLIAEKHLVN